MSPRKLCIIPCEKIRSDSESWSFKMSLEAYTLRKICNVLAKNVITTVWFCFILIDSATLRASEQPILSKNDNLQCWRRPADIWDMYRF